METILICLNQLGIGGVETVVLNQTEELLKKNHKVIILAKDGIYREKIEKFGAKFEKIDFKVENRYDLEKIKDVEKIIEKYKVTQVHIHQFDCINIMVPACIKTKIPYLIYLHTGITGVYDWFENSYLGYDSIFKIAFNCAEKLIAITKQAKDENQKFYKIEDDKYIIFKNSIKLDKKEVRHPKKIENFLIISRFGLEKLKSITNGIKIFKEYYRRHPNSRLTIVGDGAKRNEIEKEINEISNVTKMLGKRNDVLDIIEENDVVIGLDRCILEAISKKRIAVISGYEEIKEIVTEKNIEKASYSNFSGSNLKTLNEENIVEKLESLDTAGIEKIVNANYEYAYNNLNIKDNIYLLDTKKAKYHKLSFEEMLEILIKMQNRYFEKSKEADEIYKELVRITEEQKKFEKLNKENKENIFASISEKEAEIQKLKDELNKIYSGKTWKIANAMSSAINKIRKNGGEGK